MYYILDENDNPIPEPDVLKWGRWFQDHNEKRLVKHTRLENVRVSTVFLAINHNWNDSGAPLLYETMVFPNESGAEVYADCYPTRAAALAGHDWVVAKFSVEEFWD